MMELAEGGSVIDVATLQSILSKYRETDTVGGVAYIFDLDAGIPNRPIIRDYVRIVKDKALSRTVTRRLLPAPSRAHLTMEAPAWKSSDQPSKP